MTLSRLSRLVRRFQRLDAALWLLALALVLVVLGSLFPQLAPEATERAEDLSRAQQAVGARYGALARWLWWLGAFRVGRSPLLLAILGLLTLSTGLCLARRAMAIWRQWRCPPIVQAGLWQARARYTWQGPLASPAQAAAMVACVAGRGYRLREAESDDARWWRADRHGWTGLGTLATHVGLVGLVLGALLTMLGGWRESLDLAPGAVISPVHRRDLSLSQVGFEVALDPQGNPTTYVTQVQVRRRDLGATHVLRVNHPLRVAGVRIYLSSYWRGAAGYSVAVLVARDPGWPVVLVGGLLLTLGCAVTLLWRRSTILLRAGQGALTLALLTRADPVAARQEWQALQTCLSPLPFLPGDGP